MGEDFTLGERKAFEAQLSLHNDTQLFVSKIQLIVDPKKRKNEERTLVIGKHRLYFFKSGKFTNDCHLLDILEVSSPSGNQLSIKMKSLTISLADPCPEQQVDDIITNLYLAHATTFPGKADSFSMDISPEDRARKYRASVEKLQPLCSGFVDGYQSLCDYHGCSPCLDISWDINNLYVLNDVTDFNLNDLSLRQEKLSVTDIRILMQALTFNSWFTTLTIENLRLEKEFTSISEVLQSNRSLQTLNLRNIEATKDTFQMFANSFSANRFLQITSIDFSGNPMEDKGVTALANCLPGFPCGLVSLNVSRCGLSAKGISTLVKAIEGHEQTCSSLKMLSLSGNRIDMEGSKALGSLFAKTPMLVQLNVSFGNPDFHLMKKCESLQNLEVSGFRLITKDAKYMDFYRFMQLASAQLTHVNLSKGTFPVETLMFESLFELLPKLEHFDVSENNLGDQGILALCDAIANKAIQLKHLNISHNFEKASKLRTKCVQRLSQLLAPETTVHIESLYIAGSPKAALRADLMPLIFSLMTNSSLKLLDITGNQIGNAAALGLSKVLQTNSTLESLYWDENGTSFFGFQIFKVGLSRNSTLKTMPLPILDITAIVGKEKQEKLPELIGQIQALLTANCLNTVPNQNRETSEIPSVQKPSQPPPVIKQQLQQQQQQQPQQQPAMPRTFTTSASNSQLTKVPSVPKRGPLPQPLGISNNSSFVGQPQSQLQPQQQIPIQPQMTEYAQQQQQQQPLQQPFLHPAPKKMHPMRMKPNGIDTRAASALFGQLNEYLESNTAKEQLSPEELEDMKAIMKRSGSEESPTVQQQQQQ